MLMLIVCTSNARAVTLVNLINFELSSALSYHIVPPKVLKLEGVPLLYEGENLQLTCQINGIPAPSVEWYFRRQLIIPSTSGRISFPEPTVLIVKFVTLDDEGKKTQANFYFSSLKPVYFSLFKPVSLKPHKAVLTVT